MRAVLACWCVHLCWPSVYIELCVIQGYVDGYQPYTSLSVCVRYSLSGPMWKCCTTSLFWKKHWNWGPRMYVSLTDTWLLCALDPKSIFFFYNLLLKFVFFLFWILFSSSLYLCNFILSSASIKCCKKRLFRNWSCASMEFLWQCSYIYVTLCHNFLHTVKLAFCFFVLTRGENLPCSRLSATMDCSVLCRSTAVGHPSVVCLSLQS